ncbi:hypothetical protein ElyMa_003051200 [Elysia marginata]|uniref:Uncharacterized protein n=1 Tax=Elysia marginata TaxID=1093978 RepID=A0AAV4IKA9_9GAST|nr:hypothetical protein ElyMa_003051200 [Elysia marginata]
MFKKVALELSSTSGTQGRQSVQRRTAPDILFTSNTGRERASISGNDDGDGATDRSIPGFPFDNVSPHSDTARKKSLWGSALGSSRFSPSGSESLGIQDVGIAAKRRGSYGSWALGPSAAEHGRSGNKALNNVRNTRKFIYSLTRMMGKTAETKVSIIAF